MKRKYLLLILVLCLLLCGCDTLLDGEYHNVTPHLQSNEQQEEQIPAVCTTYREIRDSLIELVENGTSKGVIYMEGFTQKQMEFHMDEAIRFATGRNAIGAYAVDEITYEVGTNAATPAIAVEINYLHSRSEILRIKRTRYMTEAMEIITAALDACSDSVIFYVESYTSVDITQLVEDYVDENPHICMETPKVNVVTYPEGGLERVVQITFTYQTSRETLRSMQDNVKPVFSSAELYVQGDAEEAEKYSQLYSFLMERYDYTVETSITPSYSLLRHGVGDSKAFALVFDQMCELAGLECMVLSGTKAGEAWYWNAVQIDDAYYHLDLLECNAAGHFQTRVDDEMSGYVWDYSQFTSVAVSQTEETE